MKIVENTLKIARYGMGQAYSNWLRISIYGNLMRVKP